MSDLPISDRLHHSRFPSAYREAAVSHESNRRNFCIRLKDPVCGVTHLIGALLSIVGLFLLLELATSQGTAIHMISFSFYGLSLIALYTASALYHSLHVSKAAQETLRQLDYAMIYILIVGTYTPVCLTMLANPWGYGILGLVWGMALCGIMLTFLFRYPSQRILNFSFALYLLMGWTIVLGWVPLVKILSAEGVFLMVLGGLFYTFGAVIMRMEELEIIPGFFGAHEIWHLMVMAGSFSHFWMILKHTMG